MPNTNVVKRKQIARDHVISIRLDEDTLTKLGEIALEVDRSKAAVLSRAVREYVEREFEVLKSLRESEKDFASGKTVSGSEVQAWLTGRREPRRVK